MSAAGEPTKRRCAKGAALLAPSLSKYRLSRHFLAAVQGAAGEMKAREQRGANRLILEDQLIGCQWRT
jgi:hypothetical protein